MAMALGSQHQYTTFSSRICFPMSPVEAAYFKIWNPIDFHYKTIVRNYWYLFLDQNFWCSYRVPPFLRTESHSRVKTSPSFVMLYVVGNDGLQGLLDPLQNFWSRQALFVDYWSFLADWIQSLHFAQVFWVSATTFRKGLKRYWYCIVKEKVKSIHAKIRKLLLNKDGWPKIRWIE